MSRERRYSAGEERSLQLRGVLGEITVVPEILGVGCWVLV
jgi:hypothetical protein